MCALLFKILKVVEFLSRKVQMQQNSAYHFTRSGGYRIGFPKLTSCGDGISPAVSVSLPFVSVASGDQ